MCLSAIYWARIDKVYYANTRKDAQEIDFDDSLIYSEFEKNLRNYNLSKFSIAVSGGVDSMALAFLAKCHSIKKNSNYLYFTVDHKLRSTSTKEAIQTKQKLII